MPPKFELNEIQYVYLRCTGGEVGATASLAPKIGPLGLDWCIRTNFLYYPQSLYHEQSSFNLIVCFFSVKHNGNITLDDVTNVAKVMRPRSMARHLSGTVKEILGTCQSVGCTVDGMAPHDVIDKINSGEIEIEDSD
ncbi:predicted protein [Nematostella vectensis]|uniref:Large ribosomal subunit protein uL11 n=1 Tax=Nematostella vectensis TaxID=45351 RepID=A7TCB3_NEMVE|nr:predicted protein [Nematostella vectensis]|eukprot:XP_001618421.1 hypothetical protein NEMVEDRAFT_v1g225168 [Nematostella vectensis]